MLRDLWLPGLVGLVGALLSLASWGLLVAERREQLLEVTRETAAETRSALEQGLAQQLDTLRGLAALWTEFGLPPLEEWSSDVDQRVDQAAGLSWVAWVDLDTGARRVAAGSGRAARNLESEIELGVSEAGRNPQRPRLVGPVSDRAGRVAYRISLPVRTHGGQRGVLVASFRVAPLLDELLQARAEGHALSVGWKGGEIYARGEPSADPWQRWWRVEETLDLPLGQRWTLLHRPTAAFAAERLDPFPHYLLAAGVLLSIVLAMAAHQLRVILRQSRFLAASNLALERRGLELESRVAERTEALQDAIDELEAFNYSVSHDLRSPLGAILNFAAILEEDYRERPLDAEGAAILARIRRSATRATALLEDLLQLSRAGRADLNLSRVDMNALAREVFAQVCAAQDDAEVELLLDPLPPATGDRVLLGTVFSNLFGNALKYSRGCEKRRVRVSGRAEGDERIYEVSDNGRGFEMRFAEKLFGLFERLHAEEEIEGTGLGLALVARIVKRHGGRVWAEGRPGEGARFGFALPERELP